MGTFLSHLFCTMATPKLAKSLRIARLFLFWLNLFLHVFFFEEVLFRTNRPLYLYLVSLILVAAGTPSRYPKGSGWFEQTQRWLYWAIACLAAVGLCQLMSKHYYVKALELISGQ